MRQIAQTAPLVYLAFLAYVLVAVFAVDYAISAAVRRAKLRSAVYNNLDSAFDSNQFMPGSHLHDMSVGEIAYDLTQHAEGLELESPENLFSYVNEWVDKNKHSLKVRGAECVKHFRE